MDKSPKNTFLLFSKIQKYEYSFHIDNSSYAVIDKKYLVPKDLSQREVFENFSLGNISIVRRKHKPIKVTKCNINTELFIKNLIKNNSPVKHRIRTDSKFPIALSISEIMSLWGNPSTKVHSTDVSVERSHLNSIINTKALSDFNIFKKGDKLVSGLEMLALTVSTKGSITDSHSDDSDGITHGIIGKKLWLAWDSDEGMQRGLEDSERIDSNSKPKFDLNVFLKLDSSRWFIVDEGTTLYLPGIMAHKVITLENYIGLSSFNLSFPSLLNTLSKWITIEPLFIRRSDKETGDMVFSEIIKTTLNLTNRLRTASKKEKDKWGFDYFLDSKENFFKDKNVNDFIKRFPEASQSNLRLLLE